MELNVMCTCDEYGDFLTGGSILLTDGEIPEEIDSDQILEILEDSFWENLSFFSEGISRALKLEDAKHISMREAITEIFGSFALKFWIDEDIENPIDDPYGIDNVDEFMLGLFESIFTKRL